MLRFGPWLLLVYYALWSIALAFRWWSPWSLARTLLEPALFGAGIALGYEFLQRAEALRRSNVSGSCPKCDYALTGCDSAQCPECGQNLVSTRAG